MTELLIITAQVVLNEVGAVTVAALWGYLSFYLSRLFLMLVRGS